MSASEDRTKAIFTSDNSDDSSSDHKSTLSFNIDEKVLKVNFESLRPIALRQIISLMKRYCYHPELRLYIKYKNLVILDDKIFRNLNYRNLLK